MNDVSVEVRPPELLEGNRTIVPEGEILQHPEQFFQSADILWMLVCSALVFLMILGVCLLFSGATDRRSALLLFRLPFVTAAVALFEFWFCGYMLAFSGHDDVVWSWYGMEARTIGLRNVLVRPVGTSKGKIPEIIYALFQGMFAAFTAALVASAGYKKPPTGRFLIFILIWSALVYYPMARWTWHPLGWTNDVPRPPIDFAGGTPVHINSGATWAAIWVFSSVKRRYLKYFGTGSNKERGTQLEDNPNATGERDQDDHRSQLDSEHDNPLDVWDESPPHSVNNTILGTALLWFGWNGFNGGSALALNMRAVVACVSTNISACAGGTTGLIIYWIWNWMIPPPQGGDNALSVSAFCDGVLGGLVAITPASGYVPVWSASIFGVLAALTIHVLKLAVGVLGKKKGWKFDAPLYVCIIHAGCGMVGMGLTACFARSEIASLDGETVFVIEDGSPRALQVGYQVMDGTVGFLYAFLVSLAILLILDFSISAATRGRQSFFEGTLNPKVNELHPELQHRWRVKGAKDA